MHIFKSLLITAALATAALAQADSPFSADESFGAAMPHEPAAQSLREAIAGLDGESRMVKIQGEVTEVCQAKGCWMILMDGDTYARITFEDYGFFVPIETSMQRSVVYGLLSERVLSGEEAEHYAQDAGARSTLKLKGEVREYSLVARSVQLENQS